MPEEQSYYEEMGIPLDATESQIREAYKRLAKKYHPDLNSDMPQWASAQMKKLNMMYDTLSDSLKRQLYDRKIGKKQPSATSQPRPEHSEGSRRDSSAAPQNDKRRFGSLSAKTLRTAAIGTIVSGLTAFLILSFLPIRPSKDEPAKQLPLTISDKGTTPYSPPSQGGDKGVVADISKAEVYYKQGVGYVKDGKLHEAVAEFEKAIEISPEHFRAHAYLGFTYDAEGRLDEAIHEYEKAISLNPDFAAAYYGLAVIYNKKGMFDRAERELEIYKWLSESNTE